MESTLTGVGRQKTSEEGILLLSEQQSSHNDVSCCAKLHQFLTYPALVFAEGFGTAGPAGYLAAVYPTLNFDQIGSSEYIAFSLTGIAAVSLALTVASFSSWYCCASSPASRENEVLPNELKRSSYQSVPTRSSGDALRKTDSGVISLDQTTSDSTFAQDISSLSDWHDVRLNFAQGERFGANVLPVAEGQAAEEDGPPMDIPPELPPELLGASSGNIMHDPNTLPPSIFNLVEPSTSEHQPPMDLPPSLVNTSPGQNYLTDEKKPSVLNLGYKDTIVIPEEPLPKYNARNTIPIIQISQANHEVSTVNTAKLEESKKKQGTSAEAEKQEKKPDSAAKSTGSQRGKGKKGGKK